MTSEHALIVGLVVALAATALLALCALGGVVWLWREVARVRLASRSLGDGGLYGLDQLLREHGLRLRQVDERATELERRLGITSERLARAIRRVSVRRFNPFRDSGGDQSFVIALLDDTGCGVVLTGLHSRAEMRVYAKPVRAGSSANPLSDEEIAAIRAAAASDDPGGDR